MCTGKRRRTEHLSLGRFSHPSNMCTDSFTCSNINFVKTKYLHTSPKPLTHSKSTNTQINLRKLQFFQKFRATNSEHTMSEDKGTPSRQFFELVDGHQPGKSDSDGKQNLRSQLTDRRMTFIER